MPPITQGKTNWKFLLIVAVLVAFVGGGVLSWTKKQETLQPLEIKIPEKVKDNIADWQTYRNEKYGFEVMYPKDVDFKIIDYKSPDDLKKYNLLSRTRSLRWPSFNC